MVLSTSVAARASGPNTRGNTRDGAVNELLDQRTEGICLREPRDLVAELEVVEDPCTLGKKPFRIGLEVRPQLLLARASSGIAQGKRRRVVEGLAGGWRKRSPDLMHDTRFVERSLHVEHSPSLVCSRTASKVPEHHHRENHVPALAAHIQVPEDIVGDTRMKLTIVPC